MIKMKVDMAKLQKDLEKTSKRFGDTTSTAVARWGVQTCRELAVSTQAYGKTGTKKKQVDAITAGLRAVVIPLTGVRMRANSISGMLNGKRVSFSRDQYLPDAESVNRWVERHRSGKARRTKALPMQSIGVTSRPIFNRALRQRKERAGMAKGGWLGAGQEIARHQKGEDRINIGKNFLGYAQKHVKQGNATKRGSNFNPLAVLSNNADHSGSPYVLSRSQANSAIQFGLKKTLNWYRMAARKALNKA